MILNWLDKGTKGLKQKLPLLNLKAEVFYCKNFLTISQFQIFTCFIRKEGRSMYSQNKKTKKLMNLIWGL